MIDKTIFNDYVYVCEPASQTREASVGGSGEHRPPRRRISGGSQASLCPRKLSSSTSNDYYWFELQWRRRKMTAKLQSQIHSFHSFLSLTPKPLT